MTESGFINGYPDKTFRPADKITRAEVVTIIDKMVTLYAVENGVRYTGNFDGFIIVKGEDIVFDGVTLNGNLIVSDSVTSGTELKNTVVIGRIYGYAYSSTVDKWNGSSISKPMLIGDDTYAIYKASELAWIARQVSNGTDFEQYLVELRVNVDLDNKNWMPIGSRSNSFRGFFDGFGQTIYNLYVNTDNLSSGLFGDTHDAMIFDVTLSNANVTGVQDSGALIGDAFGGRVENCTVNGDLNITGYLATGGLVGSNYAYINNCLIDGNITVSGAYQTGGIVGANGSTVDNCLIDGNVTVSGTNDSTGGLVGMNWTPSSSVTNCVVTGNISVSGADCTGGLVGWHLGSITGCNVGGDITVAGIGRCVDSLIGLRDDPAEERDNNVLGEITLNRIVDGDYKLTLAQAAYIAFKVRLGGEVYTLPAEAAISPVSDVSPDAWYYPAMYYLIDQGILFPYRDTIKPDRTIDRATYCRLMANALGLEENPAGDSQFIDVYEGSWYFGCISPVVNAGLISGIEGNSFRPDDLLKLKDVGNLAEYLADYL